MRVFERRASHEAEIYAEAQSLLDDGFDVPFVLDLFPEERAWLEPMLATSTTVRSTIESESPSFYFEASLKAKFLSAARERSAPAPALSPRNPVRTSLAGAGVLAAVSMLGVATFGFITAEEADPGDWNYGLKQTNERIQYALARGNGKVDVQLRQAENRIYEIQRQQQRGGVSVSDIERFQNEARELTELASKQPFDEIQLNRLQVLSTTTNKVLEEAQAKKPELAPAVSAAKKSVDDAVSAGTGASTTSLPAPTPAATASPAPSPTSEASPSPEPSASPSPAGSATPEPTPAPADTPAPSATPEATPKP